MTNREEAKDARRRRIIQTARELVAETEQTRFSMRVLAKRANVSIATPYNLIGSKQAIMYALLEEDLQVYTARLARSRKDSLDLLFEAVSLGRKFFDQDKNFYRTVLFAVYSGGGPEYRSMFSSPRRALWQSLVESAVRDGYLISELDAEAFATILAHIFVAAILEWVSGEITLQEMEARTLYGFALVLSSSATPAYRDHLHDKILKSQKRTVSLTKKRLKAAAQLL